MNLKIKFNRRYFKIQVKECKGIKKYLGLMFKFKPTPLLFNFNKETKKPIHSFFCSRFLALWLDKENKVREFKIVKPFTPLIKPKNKFVKLIEIPLHNRNKDIINFIVGNRKIYKLQGFKKYTKIKRR